MELGLCLGVSATVVDGTRSIEIMDCDADPALVTWRDTIMEEEFEANGVPRRAIDDGRNPFRGEYVEPEPEVVEPEVEDEEPATEPDAGAEETGTDEADPDMTEETDTDGEMGEETMMVDYPDTVVDVLMGNANYSTLLDLITGDPMTGAGLKDALMNATQNFTLFAPTNDAFMMVSNDTKRYTMEGYETHLADILSFHAIVGEKVLSTDLTNNMDVTMGNGEDALIKTRNGANINDIAITAADMMADNGVVHEIAGVLFPSWTETDIVGLASSEELSDVFSSLVENVIKANLTGPLMGEGPFTVFAPTNEAFAAAADALAAATMGEGEEMDMDALAEILMYHVHAGAVFSDSVEDGVMLEMLTAESVTFTVMEVMVNSTEAVDNTTGTAVSKAVAPTYIPMVNGAKILQTDILANNGVIHIIDTVLIPKDMMMMDEEMDGEM